MPRVLVQTRMRVERMLGYNLAFHSVPRQYERILVAIGITRDPRFLRDCSGNFYMTFAMTLSCLHSRFPTCLSGASRSRCRFMCWNLWVSILLGFLDLESTCVMWFDILFGTWDYLLSVVGVGHLGLMRLGGSAFSLLPLRSVRNHHAWSILFWHLPPFYLWIVMMDGYILWWMLYILWWMVVSCMVDGLIYFIVLCIMDLRRMMYFYFYICIFF